ncbi:MAG: BREX-1 system adenine-specific DNA-methyltransferase PglX, partial [Selenomonas sp.]|nr:BREX-1 system adenine-specific DNA-methyltransferase PglX [Selenomonas sp.]
MDKLSIKKYAIYARNELIERVTQRAYEYGVLDDAPDPACTQTPDGTPFTPVEVRQRERLLLEISRHGFRAVMEAAAYTWFNRFAALRFLEVNGYLPSQVRVFTNDAGAFRPAILDECIQMDEPWLDKARIFDYKEASETSALYKYLVIAQCNALGEALPATFEPIADWTELLFPDHILREGSVIDHLVNDIPEDDWRDAVQIIGWLYQYYNTEPKDAVFASKAKVRKQDIPAATQLFTPDWIVRYMVENSLGRYWLERHPEHTAETFDWRYYLPEAEQDPEVSEKLAALRAASQGVRPEDIRLVDPCMGSGHILVYAFDVLYQIYEAAGYPRRKIASLILEHNLYGLDIDERACQLASFAVMMKARQYDKRIFTRGIQPHLAAIEETNALEPPPSSLAPSPRGLSPEATGGVAEVGPAYDTKILGEVNTLLETFRDAKEYGSLLTVEAPADGILDRWQALKEQASGDLLLSAWIGSVDEAVPKLVMQAELLAQKYEVVVTNPPYMASSGMDSKLTTYVRKKYPNSKGDLFAIFIERCSEIIKAQGYQAMITQHSWMFLSSFEKLRGKLLQQDTVNMIHLGARAFEEIGGEVVQTTAFVFRKGRFVNYQGTYCRLIEPTTQNGKEEMFLAGRNRYVARQENFSKIPGAPVAYWVGKQVYDSFIDRKNLGQICEIVSGMTTGNNDKYLRRWYEVDINNVCSISPIFQLAWQTDNIDTNFCLPSRIGSGGILDGKI